MSLQDNLQEKLRADHFVLTAEVTPPASFDRADLLAKALPLKGLADAVNVTDGAGARMERAPNHEEAVPPVIVAARKSVKRLAK